MSRAATGAAWTAEDSGGPHCVDEGSVSVCIPGEHLPPAFCCAAWDHKRLRLGVAAKQHWDIDIFAHFGILDVGGLKPHSVSFSKPDHSGSVQHDRPPRRQHQNARLGETPGGDSNNAAGGVPRWLAWY